jgi:hypothetical protein
LAESKVKCPDSLLSAFSCKEKRENFVQHIYRCEPQIDATVCTTGSYSIGSFNRSDMWNQRRALIAYFGTAQQPAFARLRCMHDGYDFCAGLVSIAQIDNMAAGLMCFADDYGDKHFALDRMQGGLVRAAYIAMRFESNIALTGKEILDGRGLILQSGNAKIGLAFFGEGRIIKGENFVDFVFYEGESKRISLRDMPVTYGGFAMAAEEACVSDSKIEQALAGCKIDENGPKAKLTFHRDGRIGEASVPKSVNAYKEAFKECESEISCAVQSSNHTWVVV